MFKLPGIALAGAIIVPSVAFASPVSITRSQHVSYADLDLAHSGGRAELRRRVWAATDTVCSAGGIENITSDDVSACRQSAWLDARKQIRAATEYAMRSSAGVVLATR